jgi:hypothetical protein
MNTEEVKAEGFRHPPAVKVGADVFVWCREAYGLDEVQGSFGLTYQQRRII